MVDKIDLNKILSKLTVGFGGKDKPFEDIKLFPSDFAVKKSEILSVFSTEDEKHEAEQIFEHFNLNENKIDGEDILDISEITNIAEELVYSADMDGDIYNINDDEISKYFQDRGIHISPKTFMRLLNKITSLRDYSTNVRSGKFTVNGVKTEFTAERDDTDTSGRTYILSAKASGKKQKAVFGGKEANLQIMTYDFYSKFLNNSLSPAQKVIAPNGVVGVIIPDETFNSEDNISKKALDIFIGNTEENNFNSAFGTGGRNNKKSFAVVPEEIKEIAKDLSKDDVVKILKTMADYDEKAVNSLLKKYNYDKQYSDILIGRKHFAKAMLKFADDKDLRKISSGEKFTEELFTKTLEDEIKKCTDTRVLLDYQKAIDGLTDLSKKEILQKLLNDKKDVLANADSEIPAPTRSEVDAALEKYGYVKTNEISAGRIYQKEFTGEELARLKKKYGNNADAVKELLEMTIIDNDIIKTITQRASIGYDVLANRENFDTFILTSIMMNDLQGAQNYEAGQYDLVQESAKNWPNKAETKAIDFYKSEDYWKINNALTELKKDDVEPSPKISKMINRLTNLIDKTRAPKDFSAYRGEGYEVFNSIKLSSGEPLGKAMERIAQDIVQAKAPASKENKEKINAIIEEVQNSNFEAVQERFMSTSMSEETALGFGKTELVINAPAGSKAISIDAVNVLNNFVVEEEILFQRGSKLTITDLEYNYKINKWVIYASVETN